RAISAPCAALGCANASNGRITMAPAASAVEVMSSSRRERFRFRMTLIPDSIGSLSAYSITSSASASLLGPPHRRRSEVLIEARLKAVLKSCRMVALELHERQSDEGLRAADEHAPAVQRLLVIQRDSRRHFSQPLSTTLWERTFARRSRASRSGFDALRLGHRQAEGHGHAHKHGQGQSPPTR